MSVTLEAAKEVLTQKLKAYAQANGYELDEDTEIAHNYSEYGCKDFCEKAGVTEVENWGGEGEGDSIGYTLKFTVDGETVYLKFEGYYDSWNGTDWSEANVKLVKPVERMVTFYE